MLWYRVKFIRNFGGANEAPNCMMGQAGIKSFPRYEVVAKSNDFLSPIQFIRTHGITALIQHKPRSIVQALDRYHPIDFSNTAGERATPPHKNGGPNCRRWGLPSPDLHVVPFSCHGWARNTEQSVSFLSSKVFQWDYYFQMKDLYF